MVDLTVTPSQGFDPLSLEYADFFTELQGNILKGHGRDHSAHLFLRFTGDVATIKQAIAQFGNLVTSAKKQAEEAKRYKQQRIAGDIFANFFLSVKGYQYLQFDIYEFLDDLFLAGMKEPNSQANLGDDSTQWESGYQNEIHALVLLADDKTEAEQGEAAIDPTKKAELPARLQQAVADFKAAIFDVAEVVQEEVGFRLTDFEDNTIEHFGFRDGISQPLFLIRDIERYRKQIPGKDDFSQWDPRAPLSLVLLKDPFGKKADNSYGSYLVYRKLEQNVKGWNEDVKALA